MRDKDLKESFSLSSGEARKSVVKGMIYHSETVDTSSGAKSYESMIRIVIRVSGTRITAQ